MKRTFVAIVGSILLTLALPQAQQTFAGDGGGADGCLLSNAQGMQFWVGQPAQELVFVGTKLQAVADEHPDQIAGVSYCTRYDGAVVFVSNLSPLVRGKLALAQREHPKYPVRITEVAAGLNELLATANKVQQELGERYGIVEIGPNMYTGGVDIRITNAEQIDQLRIAAESMLTQQKPSSIPLKIFASGTPTNSTQKA